MGADHTGEFIPRHGTCAGSILASRGRELHCVFEVYRGAAMVTLFTTFPPDAIRGFPEPLTRIVATLGARGARELGELLLLAADQAEAAAPQRPARASGEGGAHHGQ